MVMCMKHSMGRRHDFVVKYSQFRHILVFSCVDLLSRVVLQVGQVGYSKRQSLELIGASCFTSDNTLQHWCTAGDAKCDQVS